MLNWALIKSPINWVTVLLMTIIGMMLLNLILTPWHIPTKQNSGVSPQSEFGPILATQQ